MASDADGQAEKPFRFLELPAEIREQIYRSLLVKYPLHLEGLRYRIGKTPPYVFSEGFFPAETNDPYCLPSDEECSIDESNIDSDPLSPNTISSAIISVSRQVQQEATSVLYGLNRFSFPRVYDADDAPHLEFFDRIGMCNRNKIRWICMVPSQQPTDEMVNCIWSSDSLLKLANLEKITIAWLSNYRLLVHLQDVWLEPGVRIPKERGPFERIYYSEEMTYISMKSSSGPGTVFDELDTEEDDGSENDWVHVCRCSLTMKITAELPQAKAPPDAVLLTPEMEAKLAAGKLLGCHPSTAGLLHTLSPFQDDHNGTTTTYQVSVPSPLDAATSVVNDNIGLGNFDKIFGYLQNSSPKSIDTRRLEEGQLASSFEQEKGLKWRDEAEAADLEDNVPPQPTAASLRTKARAARRAKAKRKKEDALVTESAEDDHHAIETDSTSDSDNRTEAPASPFKLAENRKAVIQKLLFPGQNPGQPTAPVKTVQPRLIERATPKAPWTIPNQVAFIPVTPRFRKHDVQPLDDSTANERRHHLVRHLSERFATERKYLLNQAVTSPGFNARNIDPVGIHVFVDMSNITIGFHDRLKIARDISLDKKVHRVPIDFLNFSLILERGRPAAKRVVVGSDQFPHIDQARSLGYETNILERVHKAKALKKNERTPAQNGNTTSGGGSSGSETNAPGPAKWVEQAVDEILHLKILESVVDAERPGTIVLATGDAAIAEYSGGFLRMVERALSKGWCVELASFRAGLSSLYKSHKFRNQWGPMFKIIHLDEFVEYMLDVDTIRAAS